MGYAPVVGPRVFLQVLYQDKPRRVANPSTEQHMDSTEPPSRRRGVMNRVKLFFSFLSNASCSEEQGAYGFHRFFWIRPTVCMYASLLADTGLTP